MIQALNSSFIIKELAKKGALFLVMAAYIARTEYGYWDIKTEQKSLQNKQELSDSLNFENRLNCEKEKTQLLSEQVSASTEAIKENNRVLTLISK